MAPLRIGMIFGGRSVEHEVSVLTAHQAMAALPTDRYTPVPIYISKSGQWFTGEVLRTLERYKEVDTLLAQATPLIFNVNTQQPGLLLEQGQARRGWLGLGGESSKYASESIDVAFPLIHGSHGEDGTLQGLLDLADLPYTGSDVTASAIGINKALTKGLLRAAGVPVLEEIYLSRTRWEQASKEVVAEVEARFGYPVFVKPARLGSSIGVSRAEDSDALAFAIDVAATYDSHFLIEPALEELIEINCAVLGDESGAQPSVCEQPISQGLLSYEDKYMSGGKRKGMSGAQRLIPAPLEPDLTRAIQESALKTFSAIGAAGVSRIDFLVRPADGMFYVNEINTLPGSLAFYLWEASDVSFGELLHRMIGQAQTRHKNKQRNMYTFNSNLLSTNPLLGAKR
ncbi:MAG: D-alanine--D-alanine ligase [Ardenticatenales bacterium]|nr:D-alanine--D-alanine ligase [Ardenticatenales bacterium]